MGENRLLRWRIVRRRLLKRALDKAPDPSSYRQEIAAGVGALAARIRGPIWAVAASGSAARA